MKKGGKLIIFSAPSGSGKTTVVKYLLNKFDGLVCSVSACTRQRKMGKVDGRGYSLLDTVSAFAETLVSDFTGLEPKDQQNLKSVV